MMNAALSNKIKVLCVDDNSLVTDALKLQLDRHDDVEWAGSAGDADEMLASVMTECPNIVLLDIDMPGKSAFDAIGELVEICHDSRVVMYSGLIQRDLVDCAIDAGAWGYVAKLDGESELVTAIRAVASGSIGFSRSIRGMLGEE